MTVTGHTLEIRQSMFSVLINLINGISELKILFFETEISLSAIPQNIKEIKVTKDEIKISYLDSSKDKRLKKGVDFEDNLKKIYKEINFTAKAS